MTTPPSPGVGSYNGAYNITELQAMAGQGGQFGPTPSPVGAMVPYEGIPEGVPITWASQQVYGFSQEEYAYLNEMTRIYKNHAKPYSRSEMQYEWSNNIVPDTSAYNMATSSNLTPFEFMVLRNGDSAQPTPTGASGYSRVVDLTNPSDAKALADSALDQYLGRAANEEETATFLSTLNKLERQNPIVTTKTSRSGGVNREQVAKEFGRAQEGSAEFMASTQYMDWFMENLAKDPTEGLQSGLTA